MLAAAAGGAAFVLTLWLGSRLVSSDWPSRSVLVAWAGAGALTGLSVLGIAPRRGWLVGVPWCSCSARAAGLRWPSWGG